VIAIHDSPHGFHPRWIAYCKEQGIAYRTVNCYSNDLIKQLDGCKALMWHHGQQNPKDLIIAKQILFALEQAGMKVFPDFKSGWHFDDKLGQKYLLEALNAPLVPTHVFFDAKSANRWIDEAHFPKVMKLRGGAGSSNVFLIPNQTRARKAVQKAFGKGFSNYDSSQSLKDRWHSFRSGQKGIVEPVKGLLRYAKAPEYAKVLGNEVNYIYFQDFIPGLEFDYRTKVVGDKTWGYKRFVRKDDFRASGSGSASYEYGERAVPRDILEYSLYLAQKLEMPSAAFDFIPDGKDSFLLVEISALFGQDDLEFVGYFDSEMKWHAGPFDPQGWMVDSMIQRIASGYPL